MSVHPSGYYDWLQRPLSARAREDQRLTNHIKQLWLESGGHAGYRNLHLDLVEAKVACGRDRTLRLMQAAGLRAVRGYKAPKGYYGGSTNPAAPNLLERQFEVESLTSGGLAILLTSIRMRIFLFLAVVMDLYARNIVGWSMAPRMTDDLVLDALTSAYWRRKPAGTIMLHSDQGSQYTSGNCQRVLKSLDIKPSMSRRGNCHDNAVAESFFANLKKEKIRRKRFATRADARQAIFEYIEMFYNPKRRHTHNGRVSPTKYEQSYLKQLESV